MRGVPVNIEEYLTNLKPYLEVGCSLHEACINAIIPYTTVVDYMKNDEEIRKKIERMQNQPLYIARKSVVDGMKLDGDLALKYLERKKKDEFSPRSELDANIAVNPIKSLLNTLDGQTGTIPTGETVEPNLETQ
jgi:hypothetical protein